MSDLAHHQSDRTEAVQFIFLGICNEYMRVRRPRALLSRFHVYDVAEG